MRMRILLGFLIIGGILFTLIGFAYHSSHIIENLTFCFLTDHEPLHSSMRDGSLGKQVITVYCFPGYHDSVCYSASKEVLDLGYTEISPPINYEKAEYRKVTTEFRKDGVFESVSVRIGKGRFMEERPDGNLSFSSELDWINVVIRQTRAPFSFLRTLQYYSGKLSRRGARQRMTPRLNRQTATSKSSS